MKILLTGNIFHGYEKDFKEALEELGHSVDMLFNNIHGPFHPNDTKTVDKWFVYGFLPHKLKISYFVSHSVDRYNRQLQHLIRKNKYDLLLVIGGKTISEETLGTFKGPKALWFLDSLTRYEAVLAKVPLFDRVFLFEATDVQVVKERFGTESCFLPAAFNPKVFYPARLDKKYDFSFVGSYYSVRDSYLLQVHAISQRFCIYGDFYRSAHKELRQSVKKITVSRKEANQLYNATKVNINIHHSQSKEGLSPRTFEILGAGNFQLVERKKYAEIFFKDDVELCMYGSQEEFADKAKFYLNNDSARETVASNGYEAAMKAHTWKHRLTELLRSL